MQHRYASSTAFHVLYFAECCYRPFFHFKVLFLKSVQYIHCYVPPGFCALGLEVL